MTTGRISATGVAMGSLHGNEKLDFHGTHGTPIAMASGGYSPILGSHSCMSYSMKAPHLSRRGYDTLANHRAGLFQIWTQLLP